MDHTGAIFDMDGVLFDTERVYQQTWHELAGERQINLGSGFLKAITGTNGERMRRVVEEYYQVSDGLAVMEECMKRMREKLAVHVPVKDGVPEILRFFREQGVRMAVASSSLPGQIEANLRGAGIRDYFDAVVSGTEVECGSRLRISSCARRNGSGAEQRTALYSRTAKTESGQDTRQAASRSWFPT